MESILTEILRTLKDTHLRAQIIDCGNIKTFRQGEILQEEGKPIKSLLIVLTGSIKVVKTYDDSKEFLLYYITAGEACAQSIAVSMDNGTSSIKLIGEQAGEALHIPIQNALDWIGRYPTFTFFVFKAYEQHLNSLVSRVYQGITQNYDTRILEFLERKAAFNNDKEVAVTHREIAAQLGTAREVVSRILKGFEKEGKIKMGRNKIWLLY